VLRSYFTTILGEGVKVPVAIHQQDDSQLKVRIVEFADVSDEQRHPAPDPLLLAVGDATTWSWWHGQRLRAAAEPQEEKGELSILAEEEFLEYRRSLHRPKTWDDLARGLGQPARGWDQFVNTDLI
jgi:hypothetical protein